MKVRSFRSIFVLALAATLGACGVSENIDDAAAEISTFHADLDAGNLEAIWADSGKELRESTPRREFLEFLGAIHEKLGSVKSSEQVGWNTNATLDGTFVTINMATTFENGAAQEQFIYRKDEAELKLIGYNINSRDMMVK